MADQPDIVVTDGQQDGLLTVYVDGVENIIPQENAAEFIRQEINDYNK